MKNFKYLKRFNTVPTEAEHLKGGEYRTLSIMIRLWSEYAEEKGKNKNWLVISVSQLRKELGIGSNDTIETHIKTLVEEGFLLKKSGHFNYKKGERDKNCYMLNPVYWEDAQPKSKPYGDFKPVQIIEEA